MTSPALILNTATAFGQALGLLLQRARGGGRLFHQRRVLLRHLVHLRHRAVHLVDAAGLLFGRRRDLAHDVRHALAPRPRSPAWSRRRVRPAANPRPPCVDRILDQRLDFLGGLRAALRQRAHFARHHRKALALLARARRFHRRVQRQDVGLERDAVDHRHDLRNLARAGRNPCSSCSPLPTPPNRRARPRPTRWPPAGWPGARCPAFCFTVEASSSIEAAVSSSDAACCSVRLDRSVLPAEISREPTLISSTPRRTADTVRVRLSCMRLSAPIQQADFVGAAHVDAARQVAAGDAVEMRGRPRAADAARRAMKA